MCLFCHIIEYSFSASIEGVLLRSPPLILCSCLLMRSRYREGRGVCVCAFVIPQIDESFSTHFFQHLLHLLLSFHGPRHLCVSAQQQQYANRRVGGWVGGFMTHAKTCTYVVSRFRREEQSGGLCPREDAEHLPCAITRQINLGLLRHYSVGHGKRHTNLVKQGRLGSHTHRERGHIHTHTHEG